MAHRSRYNPLYTGLGVAIGMLAIIAAIVVSGIPGGPGIPVPWAHTFTVKAQLSDADALAPKAGVQIAGVKIGEVHSVDLQGDHAVVTMDLYPQYSDIHTDAQVLLRPHGLFGPKYIELVPGTAAAPLLHDGDTIPGTQAVLPVDLDQILHELQAPERQQLETAIVELGKAAAGRGSDFNHLVAAGNTFSQVLDSPLQKLSSVTDNLSDFLVKDEAFNASFAQTPLDKLIAASNVSLAAFAQTSGELGDLLNHADSALNDLDVALKGESGNIRKFLEKAPGVIDQLNDFGNQLGTFASALNGNNPAVIKDTLLKTAGASADSRLNLAAAIENPLSALSSWDGDCVYKPIQNDLSIPHCSPDGHYHYFRVQTFTGVNGAGNGPAPGSSYALPAPSGASVAGWSQGSIGFGAFDLLSFGDLIGS
jgi:virulence factor Mce-like protein